MCAVLSGQRQLKQHVLYLQLMILSLGGTGLERGGCQRAAPQRVCLPGETGRCADGRAAEMTLFSGEAPLMCSAVGLYTQKNMVYCFLVRAELFVAMQHHM